MIVFDKVHYKYHYEDFAIFKELSFTLLGGVNTILCDVQCGKSSLCKLLCNQIKPKSGKITLDGISLNANADNGVLWLGSNPTFFANKNVAENIAYPLKVRKVAKDVRLQKAKEIAQQFSLPANVKVSSLTLDQQKTLAIARAVTVQRKVVLFDDFFTQKKDMQPVFDLFENAIKVVLTSDVSLITGNTVILDDGCCAFQGDEKDAVVRAQQIFTQNKE